MKITIEITNPTHIVLLSRWASVGRTFDSAEAACHAAIESNPYEERFKIALEELKDLHRPLEELHMLVRNELWKNMCGKFVKHMFGNDYNCRLEKGHIGNCRAW